MRVRLHTKEPNMPCLYWIIIPYHFLNKKELPSTVSLLIIITVITRINCQYTLKIPTHHFHLVVIMANLHRTSSNWTSISSPAGVAGLWWGQTLLDWWLLFGPNRALASPAAHAEMEALHLSAECCWGTASSTCTKTDNQVYIPVVITQKQLHSEKFKSVVMTWSWRRDDSLPGLWLVCSLWDRALRAETTWRVTTNCCLSQSGVQGGLTEITLDLGAKHRPLFRIPFTTNCVNLLVLVPS